MLVDIAERSLSESPFQDPTTAVQAIDRLHDLLRQLARRPFPDGRHRDDAGASAHRHVDELGGLRASRDRGDPDRRRRIAAGQPPPQGWRWTDLRELAPADRTAVIDEQLERLAARWRPPSTTTGTSRWR